MGTRNLTIVQHNNEYKVAQYGQWDGYPDGQGRTVLEFLHATKGNLDHFRSKLDGVEFLTQEQYEKITNVKDWHEIRPELSRNTAAEILWKISIGDARELYNSIDFAQDSLMCEWAYVIDLDKNVLEVLKGFNHESITDGRFVGEAVLPFPQCDRKYAPIKLLKSYSLDDLPTVEQFILDCDPPKEDCARCDGNGTVKVGDLNAARIVEEECPDCKGEGRVAKVQA